jgi:hypothetical protein
MTWCHIKRLCATLLEGPRCSVCFQAGLTFVDFGLREAYKDGHRSRHGACTHPSYEFLPSCLPSSRAWGGGTIRGRAAEYLPLRTVTYILLLNDTCASLIILSRKTFHRDVLLWLQPNGQVGFRPCPRENGIKPEKPAKRGHPKYPRLKMVKRLAKLLLLR